MLRRQIFSLLLLLAAGALPFLAQAGVSGNEDNSGNSSVIYEVRKGDTLWGISKRFIEDPYYWPDLWANNPDVQNPHFIYPGQRLQIYAAPVMVVGITKEDEVRLTPPEEPPAVPAPPAPPVVSAPVIPVEEIVTVAVPSGLSFIGESEESSRGTIVDFPEGRYFAGSGDTVFIQSPQDASLRVGDRLNILKSRGEIVHPVTKKTLGFQVDQLGTLEVTALGKDLQSAVIRKNYREIERGAWLTPLSVMKHQISLRRAESEVSGTIIATSMTKEMQGKNDVLFIDFGAESGLKVGNLLTVSRPRVKTDLALISKKEPAPEYPEELVGYALVVETNNASATAVILKAIGPVVIGDLVRTQTGKPKL